MNSEIAKYLLGLGITGILSYIYIQISFTMFKNQMKQNEILVQNTVTRNTEDIITIKNKLDTLSEAVSSHNVNANESFNKISYMIEHDKIDFTEAKVKIEALLSISDDNNEELRTYLNYLQTMLLEAHTVMDKVNTDKLLNDLMIEGLLDKKKFEEFLARRAEESVKKTSMVLRNNRDGDNH